MKHNLRILFLVLTLLGLPVKLLWGQRSLDQRVIGRAVSGEPYGICVVEIPVPNPVSGRVELPLAVRENQGSNNILFPISHDLVIEVAPPLKGNYLKLVVVAYWNALVNYSRSFLAMNRCDCKLFLVACSFSFVEMNH